MKKAFMFIMAVVITIVFIYFCFTSRKQTIDSVIIHFTKKHHLSGVLLVAYDDTITYLKAFDRANRSNNRINTIDSEFLLASITKQITAAAILLLVDRGIIDLNKPVSTYLNQKSPFWKNKKVPAWADKITIHHLLTHSSGLPDYVTLPEFHNFYSKPHTTAELLQFFSYHPIRFIEGSKYEYSGTGYNVLGAIIETVSGKNYEQFLKDNFFGPLHLKHMYALQQLLSEVLKEQPMLSKGYNYDPSTKKIEPAGLVNLSTAFAEASIITNATDLYHWFRALYSGKLISDAMLKKMTTAYFTIDDNLGVGYGIYIDPNKGNLVYVHTGIINGYESIYLYNPVQKIYVIILSNIKDSNIYPLAYEIMTAAHH